MTQSASGADRKPCRLRNHAQALPHRNHGIARERHGRGASRTESDRLGSPHTGISCLDHTKVAWKKVAAGGQKNQAVPISPASLSTSRRAAAPLTAPTSAAPDCRYRTGPAARRHTIARTAAQLDSSPGARSMQAEATSPSPPPSCPGPGTRHLGHRRLRTEVQECKEKRKWQNQRTAFTPC